MFVWVLDRQRVGRAGIVSEENDKSMKNSVTLEKCFDYIENHKFVVSSIGVCVLAIVTYGAYFIKYAFLCGYFSYFGMDDSYFLNTENNAVMFSVNCILIGVLISAYFYTAIKVFKSPGLIGWKISYCLVVPIIVETIFLIIMGGDFYTVNFWLWLLVLCILYIILFLLMVEHRLRKLLDLLTVNMCAKSEKKAIIHPFICKILFILFVLFVMVCWFRHIGYDFAMQKRNYGIVTIENETYVVIEKGASDMVLKKCEVNDNILTIYKSNYLKDKNDKEIIIRTFQNVVLK